jgi:hypothetical protein
MAENIEKDAANTMASSQSTGKNKVLDVIANRFFYGNGKNSDSSGSGGGGKGTTGNGWTAEDYKNHNEYKENENRRTNETRDRDVTRHVTKSSHDITLDNTSKDAKLLRKNVNEDRRQARDQENITHAAKYGQVASIDSVNGKKRNTVRFEATPARETNPGKGAGAQGTSKQQSKPGGTGTKRTNVRTIFDPTSKAVTGYSYGGRHDAWDDKLDSRPSVKAGSKVKPGTTAGEAAAAGKPTSGTGAAIGGKVGAVAGAAIAKSPTGAALGAKAGEKLGDVIEKKIVNRKPRAKKA